MVGAVAGAISADEVVIVGRLDHDRRKVVIRRRARVLASAQGTTAHTTSRGLGVLLRSGEREEERESGNQRQLHGGDACGGGGDER